MMWFAPQDGGHYSQERQLNCIYLMKSRYRSLVEAGGEEEPKIGAVYELLSLGLRGRNSGDGRVRSTILTLFHLVISAIPVLIKQAEVSKRR